MKLILISDTHSKHENINLPMGDILIHAGDVSSRGTLEEIKGFLDWFSSQPHQYKIFIAGNHDFWFENKSEADISLLIPQNVIYLNDNGVTIEGVHFWGSPVQPEFHNWAFNRKRGLEIKKHWDLIPNATDILITHGPPHGILDETVRGQLTGCEELKMKVYQLNLKLHVFGHIHEAYGIMNTKNTCFVNASQLNQYYQPVNKPVVVDL